MSYDLEVEMIREARAAGPADVPVRVRRGRGAGDGQGRRRRAGRAPGPDHQGIDRREDGADAGRGGRVACRRCTTRRAPCARTCIVLCHGGPIAEPEDVEYVLAHDDRHRRLLRRVEHRALRHRESASRTQARRFRDMRLGPTRRQPDVRPLPRRSRRRRRAPKGREMIRLAASLRIHRRRRRCRCRGARPRDGHALPG